MYSYIKGVVTVIEPSYIVIESGGIGYMIYVSNPYSYKVSEDVVVYLLEALYQFMFVRYIYLYKEYVERKEYETLNVKKKTVDEVKVLKKRGRPKKEKSEEV